MKPEPSHCHFPSTTSVPVDFRPFTEDAERTRLLASLPEAVLLSMIEEKATKLDLPWLDLMQACSLFESTLTIDDHPHALYEAENQWSLRCEAMLDVMSRAFITTEPMQGGSMTAEKRVGFELEPDAHAFFANFCQQLGRQAQQWTALRGNPEGVVYTVSRAMALCAMMDRADVLEGLIVACPEALHNRFFGACVGRSMFDNERPCAGETMEFGPLFCALHFSSAACTKAILPHLGAMGTLYAAHSPHDSKNYTFVESLCDMPFYGEPDAIGLMAQSVMDMPKDTDPNSTPPSHGLRDAMMGLMQRKNGRLINPNQHLLPALMLAGVGDVAPKATLYSAVANGFPQVVEHFAGRIDWRHLPQSFSCLGMVFSEAITHGLTTGVDALIKISKDDGQAEQLLNGIVLHDWESAEVTAKALVSSEIGVAVLAKLLDLGLHPNSKAGSLTMVQWAGKGDGKAIDVINSFLAREKARALIDEIESEPANRSRSPQKTR